MTRSIAAYTPFPSADASTAAPSIAAIAAAAAAFKLMVPIANTEPRPNFVAKNWAAFD